MAVTHLDRFPVREGPSNKDLFASPFPFEDCGQSILVYGRVYNRCRANPPLFSNNRVNRVNRMDCESNTDPKVVISL